MRKCIKTFVSDEKKIQSLRRISRECNWVYCQAHMAQVCTGKLAFFFIGLHSFQHLRLTRNAPPHPPLSYPYCLYVLADAHPHVLCSIHLLASGQGCEFPSVLNSSSLCHCSAGSQAVMEIFIDQSSPLLSIL